MDNSASSTWDEHLTAKIQGGTATAPTWDEHITAKVLGVAVATVRRWRWAGKGPKFLKLGGAVRYDPADVQAFIDASRRSSTSDPGPEGVAA